MKLYNGAPCKQLKAKLDNASDKREEMARRCRAMLSANDRASVTYFPMESKFMGFINHKIVTEFCDSELDCINRVIEAIDSEH